MLKFCKYLFAMLYMIAPLASHCQTPGAAATLVAAVDTFNIHNPAEKIYLHLDKPNYTNTDTIWLKAYILSADLTYSKQSGLMYLELVNDTGKVVVRQSMPVKLGISFGQMVLDANSVIDGSYTLRAYTNWMQNQGTKSFFTRQLYISDVSKQTWLVDLGHQIINKNGHDSLRLALRFKGLDNNPVRLKDLQIKVNTDYEVFTKQSLQTDLDGKLYLNVNIPPYQVKKIAVTAQPVQKEDADKKLVIPIAINRLQNTDLQFMPEGGTLVAGLPSSIGFKALGEDGKPVNVTGEIRDSKNRVVGQFHADYQGIGSFRFTPLAGENYLARIDSPAGISHTYPLGFTAPSGIVMHINNTTKGDSLNITISATPDVAAISESYVLIAQSGGKVCYAANLSFKAGIIHGSINKNRFLSGITHFTLFNADKKPIAERLVYIDHNDALNINIDPQKTIYQTRDSVALQLSVRDANGKPASGSFSLSVTDDSQVDTNSTTITDIQTYMLLTGDLKGDVIDPGYYFNRKNKNRLTDLDNLLLTQGWIGYPWTNIFNPQYRSAFKAEPEIAVTGQISRLGGKVLNGLPVILLSTKRPILMRDTVSDADGRFVFRNLPRIDTANFMVQVKDKKGKMFEADINIDEFKPAKFDNPHLSVLTPWYVNIDSALLRNIKQSISYNNALRDMKLPPGTRQLGEVVVKGKKLVKGSHFFAGYGAEPDLVLEEEEIKKMGKVTLEDILVKRVKGFGTLPYPCSGIPVAQEYLINCLPTFFAIDGVYLDEFYVAHPGFTDHWAYINTYLTTIKADDVRGVEVKNEAHYNYLEITTWSGAGAFAKRAQSRYIYRPLPVTWPKQFYKPKYTAKSNNTLADQRPTVLWEPNIITDTTGKATVWFYTKSKPASYTIIVQGSNLSGNVGVGRKTVVIK